VVACDVAVGWTTTVNCPEWNELAAQAPASPSPGRFGSAVNHAENVTVSQSSIAVGAPVEDSRDFPIGSGDFTAYDKVGR
jgi:hypothetical protein